MVAERQQILYLSGPMTDYADYNFPAFWEAEEEARRLGYAVLSPARNAPFQNDLSDVARQQNPKGANQYYLRLDLANVLRADCVWALAGWQSSRGANIEIFTALVVGIPVIEQPGARPVALPAHICLEAFLITTGERQTAYGHPPEDFRRVATMAQALGIDVTPEQVALFQMLVKLSRESHTPKRDNLVDIAGYAAVADMARQRELGR